MHAKPETGISIVPLPAQQSNSAFKSDKRYNSVPFSAYFVEPKEKKIYFI